jgi:hypothetical protein
MIARGEGEGRGGEGRGVGHFTPMSTPFGTRRKGGGRASPHTPAFPPSNIPPDLSRCGACGGRTLPGNKLLRCADCGVSAHEHCLGGIHEDGEEWRCSPCSCGERSSEVRCEMCERHGGLFKELSGERQGWGHVVCALWTPDVYLVHPAACEGICIDSIEPARQRLKCSLCGEKGCCVQCSGGRCLTAFHPSCLLVQAKSKGILMVVRPRQQPPNALSAFQVFCDKHKGMARLRNGEESMPAPVSEAAALQWRANKAVDAAFVVVQEDAMPAPASASSEGDDIDDMPHSMQRRYNLLMAAGDGIRAQGGGNVDAAAQDAIRKGTAMVTFSQWPGHRMGDNMDLDHFWAAVGAYFPEDQSVEWLENVIAPVMECLPGNDDALYTVPNEEARQRSQDESQILRKRRAAPGKALPNGGRGSRTDEGVNEEAGADADSHSLAISACIESGTVRAGCNFILSGEVKGGASADLSGVEAVLRDFRLDHDYQPPPGIETEVSLELKSLQADLRGLVDSARNRAGPISEQLRKAAVDVGERNSAWSDIERRHLQVRAWKAVARLLVEGVKDQKPGFNRREELIPASWRVPVSGRPLPPSEAEQGTPQAEKEKDVVDAVCAVCFDGSAPVENQIVFCDGCNMGAHQHCYGLAEIPDNDFFCDRCTFLRQAAAEAPPGSGNSVPPVHCLLCPMLHAGFKRTTDDRWVHLACALWSPGCLLVDPTCMGPVDVTGVALEGVAEGEDDDDSDMVKAEGTPCSICNQKRGCLLSCKAPNCEHKFHFLCAWFTGCYLRGTRDSAKLLSQGCDEGFPVGVDLECYCRAHSSLGDSGRDAAEQQILRDQYRVKEEPGFQKLSKGKRKGLKAQKSLTPGGAGSDASGMGTAVVRDLPEDSYKDIPCAVCLKPEGPLVDGVEGRAAQPEHVICESCGIKVHRECYGKGKAGDLSLRGAPWTCAACSHGIASPKCSLCPRKGGAFRPTDQKNPRWVHAYCADHCPGVRVNHGKNIYAPLTASMDEVPREMRGKFKCFFCGRKFGTFVRCEEAGCSTCFHPLCAALCGMYCCPPAAHEPARWPYKHKHYCQAHTPSGICRLPSGHFVDMHAIYKVRSDLDRARLVLDCVRKREKVKRNLWRAVEDHFDGCILHAEASIPARAATLTTSYTRTTRRSTSGEGAANVSSSRPNAWSSLFDPVGAPAGSTEKAALDKFLRAEEAKMIAKGKEKQSNLKGALKPEERKRSKYEPARGTLDGIWEGVAERIKAAFTDFEPFLRTIAGQQMESERASEREPKKMGGEVRSIPEESGGEEVPPLPALPEAPTAMSTSLDRVLLDRQLRDIIDAIVDHRVPIDEEDEEERASPWLSADDSNTRRLSEMFDHVPTRQAYPEYYKIVSQPIDLDTIKHKVKTLRYQSVGDLMKDVQLMVSNARRLGIEDVSRDAHSIHSVAENARLEAMRGADPQLGAVRAGHAAQMTLALAAAEAEARATGKRVRKPSSQGIEASLSQKKQSSSNRHNHQQQSLAVSTRGGAGAKKAVLSCGACANCNSPHPGLAEGEEFDAVRESIWYCATCLAELGSSLQGRPVAVYWPQDSVWYTGRVQAYEPICGKHRIVYDDGEWEYILLAQTRLQWLSEEGSSPAPQAASSDTSSKRASISLKITPPKPPLKIHLPFSAVESKGASSKRERRSRGQAAEPADNGNIAKEEEEHGPEPSTRQRSKRHRR